MGYSSSILFAALASLACAQNPFTFTTTPVVTAGTPFNITWAPSTGTVDTVTLVLRQGDPSHLTTVMEIASSIQNTGSYLWTPPTTIVEGTGYAFEIIDDGNDAIVNYSGQFSISSTNTVSSLVASASGSASVSQASSTTTAQTTETKTTGTKMTSTASSKTTATGTESSSRTASSGTSSGSSTESSTLATATATKNAACGLRVGGALVAVVGVVAAAL